MQNNEMPYKNFYPALLIAVFFIFMPAIAVSEDMSAGKSVVIENEPVQEEIVEEKPIADPIEPWNRIMFAFNDRFYFWLLKPVSKGYSAVMPEWGRVRVRNFFHNVTMPVRLVNALLQLKLNKAGVEIAGFVLNTTAGVGGLFDVARQYPELKSTDEDTGQTLGVYGIGEGFYITWPILGPSSLRDTAGMVGDFFLDPVNYLSPAKKVIIVHSSDKVNDTSLRIGEYEDLKESAVDPYIAVRDAYTQHRRSRLKE